ncbi:hypothetical protein [Micromonospora sp. NBS 11-29]|uniref:hypothetical protein n=1 Tax=Micromonospora sp. NBS 11-29 TaxID=1960879 RepID=UPI0011248341|nr:hypothetical protein [Micromonospora sp. NBS 11-29]
MRNINLKKRYGVVFLAFSAERGTAVEVAVRHLRPGQDVYVCGPPAMLTSARRALAGVAAERLHLPRIGAR